MEKEVTYTRYRAKDFQRNDPLDFDKIEKEEKEKKELREAAEKSLGIFTPPKKSTFNTSNGHTINNNDSFYNDNTSASDSEKNDKTAEINLSENIESDKEIHEKQIEAFGLYKNNESKDEESNEQKEEEKHQKVARKKGNWPEFLNNQRGQNLFAWSSLIYSFMGGINFISILMGLYFFLYLDNTKEKSTQAKAVFIFSMIIASYNTYRFYFT